MTIRQFTSIPLLIASIIMLMSTVMPHHHHRDLICFIPSHCEKELAANACDHDHDSDSSDHTCEIQQFFRSEVVKPDHGKCSGGSNIEPDHLFFPLFVLFGSNSSLLLSGQGEKIHPPIYTERLHPITWHSVCSGRAPPTVIA